jgi:hypothetical protein
VNRPGITATAVEPSVRTGDGIACIDELLRDRDRALERIAGERDLLGHGRATLATIAIAGAVFGAALGGYRGGVQILYAAIKMPLLLLATAAICAPTLSAFNTALDRPSSMRRDLSLVLAALAIGSLVLAAEAPIVLLAICFEVGYHSLVLLTVACCAVAGLCSLSLAARGMRHLSPARVGSAAAALVLVFTIVGAQMAWTLRPWVVRPRTRAVPFVRHIEGSLIDSVARTLRSARGTYRDSSVE